MAYVEPPGTFIVPVLARGVTYVRVKDGSISIADLYPAEVVPQAKKLDLKKARQIVG